jgi:hypothetical protein
MKFIHYLFIVILLSATSCIDEALFNGGAVVSENINLPAYSTIEVESTFEIELVSDTVNKVIVSCGENLQPYIKIEVVNDVLYLKHDIKNNWSRKYDRVKLELHTKPFGNFSVRKPVRIYTTRVYKAPSFGFVDFMKYSELDLDLDVDDCMVVMSSDNFGQYKLKGRAKRAHFWGWGSCSLNADSLQTEYCYVLHRGMGNVFVNATGQLDADIRFTGNVYYSGNPSTINLQRTGSGNLIKK